MRQMIGSYYGAYNEKLVMILDGKALKGKIIDAREEISKVFSTYTIDGDEDKLYWKVYMPFDNIGWKPEGTEYGRLTEYKKRKFPLDVKLEKLEAFWKKFPETKPQDWM